MCRGELGGWIRGVVETEEFNVHAVGMWATYAEHQVLFLQFCVYTQSGSGGGQRQAGMGRRIEVASNQEFVLVLED